MNESEVKRIQLNSARQAFEDAQQAYISTLDPAQQAQARSQEPDAKQLFAEAEAVALVSEVLLGSLETSVTHQAVPTATADAITSMATADTERLQKEIEETKAQIRVEKRKFLDSGPQVSPAVGGLYFTAVPDNQVLIVFLSCYTAFWLFLGIMLLTNQIPIPYVSGLSSNDRLKLVLGTWVLLIVVTYLGFFMFT